MEFFKLAGKTALMTMASSGIEEQFVHTLKIFSGYLGELDGAIFYLAPHTVSCDVTEMCLRRAGGNQEVE